MESSDWAVDTEEESKGETEDVDDDEHRYFLNTLCKRGNMLHHPFPREAAPYMQAYSVTALNKCASSFALLFSWC